METISVRHRDTLMDDPSGEVEEITRLQDHIQDGWLDQFLLTEISVPIQWTNCDESNEKTKMIESKSQARSRGWWTYPLLYSASF